MRNHDLGVANGSQSSIEGCVLIKPHLPVVLTPSGSAVSPYPVAMGASKSFLTGIGRGDHQQSLALPDGALALDGL
jgi:hypothetical protein